ncbi:MAG: succinylglutamate desuccinylase/aspartoacylase family protein [Ilumatobacteraceae bacterium]
MARSSFLIGGHSVKPGTRKEVGLPIARLVTGAEVDLPVLVIHGRGTGPAVWIDAAIHGDEVGGVDIIHRVLQRIDAKTVRGTLIAVPVVNVLGFMNGDRYLPDRRDLNRSFPGSPRGSLAGRIAHLLMTEVVAPCDVGIDLHTGSDHRSNLPQIRADLDDERTRALAETFGAPVMIHARTRDGSLRHAAREHGAAVLLFEGGEALRFDHWAIEAGVSGVLRVLASLGMINEPTTPAPTSVESRKTGWVRAGRSGIVRIECELGDRVVTNDRVGVISNSFGRQLSVIKAARDGIVIGRLEAPLVNRGDAIVHIAEVGD